ncbi:Mvp17/PMP22 family protein 2 [Schizosaccharomyces japonicus yFS275]|uniref:Mvp17/PMP22 family protein 2 n=1 Tax=Schizosaccharomyces japonicus (strain yFS275 / FY16936) TaxID=402676 RepID=B6JW61_SCHJY|nr:Mvp17/PMP22 family protein 2 [Schizosaccharomyces japonicus yFS275]EEB05612.1 Mvp17/PMP22 family protein 2 [Schizosaccharomyces japonicus yFS275]
MAPPLSLIAALGVNAFVLLQLTRLFETTYAIRPLLTLGLLNASLAAFSDIIAQAIDMYKSQKLKDGALMEKYGQSSFTTSSRPQSLDGMRLVRLAFYGLAYTPVQVTWFAKLSTWFPDSAGKMASVCRVLMDQALFAPIGIFVFLSYMSLVECRPLSQLRSVLRKQYVSILKANYLLWPVAQLVNFCFIPLKYQVLFVNMIAVFWTTFLSLKNNTRH